MTANYNWKRFWFSNEEKYSTFRGYLTDPDIEYSVNSHLISDPTFLNEHCIIMLGEPGIGKSFELHQMKNNLEDRLNASKDTLCFIDLRGIGDAVQFENKVFNNEIIQSWINSGNNLYLFLDSFDECYLRQSIIAEIILDKISKYPLERIYLYIACRTGIWPVSLGYQLENLFIENYKVLNIAILRKVDIINALISELETEKITKFDEFFEKIESLNAVAFVVRPMTLKAIIKQFILSKDIIPNKRELFRSYCKYLCGEVNPIRRDAGLSISFTPEQKYIVAARVAALALFSGKLNFWMGVELETPADSIALSILYQGKENASDQYFDVTKKCILETLACSLFYSSDSYCLWSHWSFIEFLASEYLVSRRMSADEIMDLVKNPIDNKILPQFRGVIAWLCTDNEKLFDIVIKKEPITLILSDISFFPDSIKERIVKTIIENFEDSPLEIQFFELSQYYNNFIHPNLSNQIEEVLKAKEFSFRSKRFALQIAEKCDLYVLRQLLLEIVLNTTEHIQTRVSACYTLENFVNSLKIQGKKIEGIERLIPLALSDEILDDNFNIKGICLILLWPDFLAFNQLEAHFPEPSHGYIGSYSRFLYDYFISKLPESEIINALDWIQKNLGKFPQYSIKHRILEDILLKTLDFINDQVIEKLAQVLCSLITSDYILIYKSKETTFRDNLNKNLPLRRNLISLVLSNIPNDERYLIQLIFHTLTHRKSSFIIHDKSGYFELIHEADLEFLIEEYTTTKLVNYRKNLAYIIYRLISKEQVNLAYKLYMRGEEFKKYYKFWFGPIVLGGEEEKRMREIFKREKELAKEFQDIKEVSSPKLIEPSPTIRIANCLERFENGDINAWWHLNSEMMLNEKSQVYGTPYNPDLSKMPGWISSTPTVQESIIRASQKYILEGDPNPEEWLGKNIIYNPAYAGYRAIRLNYELKKSFIDNLSKDIWVKWTPILLLFKFYHNMTENLDYEEEIRRDLLLKAYPYAKDALPNIISREIDYLSESGSYLNILEKVEYLYDEITAKILHSKVEDVRISPKIKSSLSNFLVSHGFKPTIDFLLKILSKPIPEEIKEESIQVIAAIALIKNKPNEYWDVIYQLMQKNKVFGRILITSLSDEIRFEKSFIEQICEEYLADLYIWIYNEYPTAEDITSTGMARLLTPRDFIITFRDNIINNLEERGTFEAVEALQKIYNELNEIRHILSYRIIRAQEIARTTTWVPMSPHELYDLFQSPHINGKSDNIVVLLNILHISDFQPGKTTETDLNLLIQQGYTIKDLYEIPISEFQSKILALKLNDGIEIDAVLITGDLSSTSVEKEYKITNKLLNFFNDKPVLIAPGNHDLNRDIIDDDQKAKFNNFLDFLNNYLDSLESQEIHHFPNLDLAYYYNKESSLLFIAINTNKKINKINPKLVTLTPDYLSKIFKLFAERFAENFNQLKKILVCHHGWEKIANSQGIENFLLDMGISIILSGHEHKFYFRRIDELNNIANIYAGSLLTGLKHRIRRAGSVIPEREGFNLYQIYKEGNLYKLKIKPWKREPEGWVIDKENQKIIKF